MKKFGQMKTKLNNNTMRQNKRYSIHPANDIV